MSKEGESFWTHDRKMYLIESIREDPILWNVDLDTNLNPKFDQLADKLGTSTNDCVQMYAKLSAEYHHNQKKKAKGKKSKKFEYFDKMQFLDEIINEPKHEVEGYINDAFNDAFSDSSLRSSTTFRKAAEYMIAELENMDKAKAEILLNKTLKYFVDHRYD